MIERGGKRECTSLSRSHVLYKTQSLHRCRRHRRNGENVYVCTLAQRRGQTGRNICFPSQYSVEERLQPINPRGNELFSPISLTGYARATASSQFSICLSSPLYPLSLTLDANVDFSALVCDPATNDLPIDTI